MTYLERFETLGEATEKASANISVEVIAQDGAQVKFAAIDRLGETSQLILVVVVVSVVMPALTGLSGS